MASDSGDRTKRKQAKELRRLVGRLGHWRAKVGREAEDEIRERADELADPLLDLYAREARRQRRLSRSYRSTAWIVLAVVGISVCGTFIAFAKHRNDEFFLPCLLLGLPSCLLLLGAHRMQLNTTLQTTTACALSMIRDPRAVGPLCEALEFRDLSLFGVLDPHTRALQGLWKLLPTLTEEHADLLTGPQREILCRNIGLSNADFALRALRALQVVGTSREIPTVRAIANGKRPAARDRWVRREAQACLEVLERRGAQDKDARTLLRASRETEESTAQETLLRAAESAGASDPEHLLRPAVGTPSDKA